MQVAKSKELKRSRDDSRLPEVWLLQIEVGGPKTLGAEKSRVYISRAKAKQKGKSKELPTKASTEETASVGSQKDNVHSEEHAHSSMTRTRRAKERDDLCRFLRHVHRTEILKVTEKVAMTEVLKPHHNGKSQSRRANRLLCMNFKKGSC